jgi:hypothetical protein
VRDLAVRQPARAPEWPASTLFEQKSTFASITLRFREVGITEPRRAELARLSFRHTREAQGLYQRKTQKYAVIRRTVHFLAVNDVVLTSHLLRDPARISGAGGSVPSDADRVAEIIENGKRQARSSDEANGNVAAGPYRQDANSACFSGGSTDDIDGRLAVGHRPPRAAVDRAPAARASAPAEGPTSPSYNCTSASFSLLMS